MRKGNGLLSRIEEARGNGASETERVAPQTST